MTEITSEEDALAMAWRLLHTPDLVKDHVGLEEYLLEEGIKTVELLEYCDPEDWQHIASFLRNKPRKRFVEIMHQWHMTKTGFAAHQLLATPPVLSTASSVAMPPPPVVYGVHSGAAGGGGVFVPPKPSEVGRSAAAAIFESVPTEPSETIGNGDANDEGEDDDVQAYRIGLPAPAMASVASATTASHGTASTATAAAVESTSDNASPSTSPSKVIVDSGDIPELPDNPNVLCALPEFCVIS